MIKICDDGEGKAHIVSQVDMSGHDLEDELELLARHHWTSLVICDRCVSYEDYTFSINSEFLFKAEKSFDGQLVSQQSLHGTLLF